MEALAWGLISIPFASALAAIGVAYIAAKRDTDIRPEDLCAWCGHERSCHGSYVMDRIGSKKVKITCKSYERCENRLHGCPCIGFKQRTHVHKRS